MDSKKQFLQKKKNGKKMENLLQSPLSLRRKTAKLLNMALILPILKVLQN